jgi:sugar lactone lactonase YvrE
MKFMINIRTVHFVLFLLFSFELNGQVISTFAGGGTLSDGNPATAASICDPHFLAFDKFGNFYFSQFSCNTIREVDTLGIITTFAGDGLLGFSGDGGAAIDAAFRYPEGIAFDSSGTLYIADHQNFRIRKVNMATGYIYTVAGNGNGVDSGDGNVATAASFFPSGIQFDKRGNLYIADGLHNNIRKINALGIVSTYAGTGTPGFSGDGGAASAAQLWNPLSIATDSKDNLYLTDGMNKRIRKIDTFGVITTVGGTGVGIFDGDGIPATDAQMGPYFVAIDNYDNIYIADSNERIRKIDSFGIIHTVAGTGVGSYNGDEIPATSAQINNPSGISFDVCNNMYFGDADNARIRRVAFNPTCNPLTLYTNTVTPNRIIYIFPNPANDELNITSTAQLESLTISNMIGQTVIICGYDTKNAMVNISNLPVGVYVVRVVDREGNKIVRKIIKE